MALEQMTKEAQECLARRRALTYEMHRIGLEHDFKRARHEFEESRLAWAVRRVHESGYKNSLRMYDARLPEGKTGWKVLC